MTGYLFSLNGGAISWRRTRHGGVTHRRAKKPSICERYCVFITAVPITKLFARGGGFNFRQVGATEIWEDNASCIMMSKNPANRERTQHVDTRVHYLRELVLAGGAGSKQASLDGPRPPRTS